MVHKNIKLTSTITSKTTSVKQQSLVALFQDTPEAYQNVKAVLDLIKVQEICLMDSLVISCDLKLTSITVVSNHTAASIHTVGVRWNQQISSTVTILEYLVECGKSSFMSCGGDLGRSKDF